jgi:hypothetical protein
MVQGSAYIQDNVEIQMPAGDVVDAGTGQM